MTVRARHADHHTAGHLFTRDDREGHGDPVGNEQHWWSHTWQRWVSWMEIIDFVASRPKPGMVLEPMFAAAGRLGCAPDGACGPECSAPVGPV